MAYILILSTACLWIFPAPAVEQQEEIGSIREEALALFDEGRMGEALILFERVLAFSPDDAAVLSRAGLIHYRAEEFARAADLFRRAIRAEGEKPYTLFMLANTAFRRFELAKARRLYDKLSALEPDYTSLALNSSRLDDRIARVRELEVLRKRCDLFYWAALTAGVLLILLIAVLELRQGEHAVN
jgi:tetratricopeptide (TPR) repeat protein